jgi:hypothetical protein
MGVSRRAVVTVSVTAGALVLLANFHTSSGSSNLTVGNAAATTATTTSRHRFRRLPDHCGSASPPTTPPAPRRRAPRRRAPGRRRHRPRPGRSPHLSAAAAGRHFGEGTDRRRTCDRHSLRRCPGARRAACEPHRRCAALTLERPLASRRISEKLRRCSEQRPPARTRTSTSSQAPATRARAMPNRSKVALDVARS